MRESNEMMPTSASMKSRFAGFLLALLCLPVAAADRSEYTVRPNLDPVPASLDGILVELRQTVHPQITVFNLTNDPLLILDNEGEPFLSIGPQDVKANYARPAFHLSRYADNQPLPNNAHGPARWHPMNEAPTWGWFDTRLRVPEAAGSSSAGPVGRWSIPVQLGNTRAALTGDFVHTPAPDGLYEVIIDKQSLDMEAVTVHPMAGPRPGLFIHNRGNDKFTVDGLNGEKFLRFLPSKAIVNSASRTWKQAAPVDTVVPYRAPENKPERWTIISTAGGFGWADPRVQPSGGKPGGQVEKTVATWRIPVNTNQGVRYIEGRTLWRP
jgi:hypothetical protein